MSRLISSARCLSKNALVCQDTRRRNTPACLCRRVSACAIRSCSIVAKPCLKISFCSSAGSSCLRTFQTNVLDTPIRRASSRPEHSRTPRLIVTHSHCQISLLIRALCRDECHGRRQHLTGDSEKLRFSASRLLGDAVYLLVDTFCHILGNFVTSRHSGLKTAFLPLFS
jgi:hypothetical protein